MESRKRLIHLYRIAQPGERLTALRKLRAATVAELREANERKDHSALHPDGRGCATV